MTTKTKMNVHGMLIANESHQRFRDEEEEESDELADVQQTEPEMFLAEDIQHP